MAGFCRRPLAAGLLGRHVGTPTFLGAWQTTSIVYGPTAPPPRAAD
jgi:hypothetical protein